MVTPKIAKFIEKIKALNKEIIFETDDLVFDPKFIQATDLYKNKMNAAEKMQYQKGVGEEIVKDPYTKICTTTTTYLAKILENYGKKVYVITNKFSAHEFTVCQNILDNIPKEKDDMIRIGYFSGTASHNKDFASITDALMEVMEKYKNVKLFIAGQLDVEHRLNKFKDRIFTLPFVKRDKYFENIWKVDINLAPLVLGDPFCESKSAIKFTETGILKIPTVAIKNQTFSEAITDGVDGFLADNTQEWVEKISRLVEDNNLRKNMGEKAREKIIHKYTIKNSRTDDYYQYLNSIIKNNKK
jgi:glycosyltransferase involved in cell wall biosynthesis